MSERFDLSGGTLCLDFANTWEDRERPETEKLRGYDALLAFARQTGLMSEGARERLAARAREDRAGAEAAFRAARELREAIYRIFSARAGGGPAPADDLARLNEALPDALGGLRVERADSAYAWSRCDASETLAAPVRPVVRSAAELLVAGDPERVRECHGTSCTWLFLDQSRNRSRRWCSMETCGNRAKARRHYRRAKRGEGEG
jgi:predicted RNA-binding Zn ribbon-like protein